MDTVSIEQINTPAEKLEYRLTRKKVKNINLRVGADGNVAVSAGRRVAKREIEQFLLSRWGWIEAQQRRLAERPPEPPCPYTREQCLAVFRAVSDSIFPLFSDLLGGEKPTLRVREMKTRWGVCKPSARQITLNSRLMMKPRAALEYVVMHEYVHFLHADHQAGFYAELARLMPDYKERRKLLK